MSEIIKRLERNLLTEGLHFESKPILIGGMAMEYYGIRKSGADIDLVIRDEDYQTLAANNPDKRKDLWGDLGVVIEPFEIWRSIARLDYNFYSKDAIDEGIAFVVSLDRLLFMRVIAMDVEKYKNDLHLMKEYYYKTFVNHDFAHNMEKNMSSYEKHNGAIFGGKYLDLCLRNGGIAMNDALMERLQLFLTKEGNQSLLGTPATEEQIAEAEKQLGLSLDQDYVQFIRSFGGAYAGLSVHAFSNGSSIGRESVIELTLSFREDYKDTPMNGLLARSAVFSMDGSGNPILLDPEGRVLLIDHDNGNCEVIAKSFAALIEENFMEW